MTTTEPTLATSTDGMDRADWLALRSTGIGGSDVAAIARMSRWRTPLSVWLEKVGLYVPEDDPSEAMEWGRRLEAVVADEFSARTGVPTEEHRFLLRHPERPWQLANLDRRVVRDTLTGLDEPGVYEGKCTDGRFAGEWAHNAVPDYAALQTHHYLLVDERRYGYVAVLIGGNRLEWRRVERDDDIAAYLTKIEADFWARVVNLDPPAPEPEDAALLGQVWTPDPESCVDLSPEHLALLAERADAKAAAKAAEERAETAQAAIEMALRDAEYGLDADGDVVCSWKRMDAVPVKAHVRAAHRRFLTHKPKKDNAR